MATTGVVAVEALPKFLLPKLSWKTTTPLAATARHHATRGPSIRSSQRHPTASFHSASLARPRAAPQSQPQTLSPILSQAGFHTTAPRQRDHHFDTLKFVQRLQDEGFTEDQSVAMMKVLNDVIEERYCSLSNVRAKMLPSSMKQKV